MSNEVRPVFLSLPLAVLGLLAMSSISLGQARETKVFPVTRGETLVVQNDYGRVRVQGTDSSQAEIQINRLAASSSQLENIVVLAQQGAGKLFVNSYFYDYVAESVYLDILVPRTMNVVIWGANPAVELTSLSGYVKVFTQTGLVTATDLTSSVSLSTESGDILYRSRVQPDADIRLESVLGKVRCHLAEGLNLRGWIRAGSRLSWNNEINMERGQIERQVGIGGPLFFAASQSGAVSVDLDLTYSDTQTVALSLPPDRGPVSYPTPRTPTPPAAPQPSDSGTPASGQPDPTSGRDRGPAPVLRPSSGGADPQERGGRPEDIPPASGGDSSEVVYTTNPDGTVDSGYSLKVNVNWTYLNVSVRDRISNRSVPNLGVDDFIVYEDGQLQRIERFESAEAPFSLLLLLDVSGSTKDYMDLIKDASISFTREIKSNDQIAVATFNSRTHLVQDFTNDRRQVEQSIRRIRSGGGTAFYDALETSVNDYMSGMEGRKAIVVFSDGEDNQLTGDWDNGSRTSFPELYRDIQEVDTIIYTIFLNDGQAHLGGGRGRPVPPRRTGSVADILGDILRGGIPKDDDARAVARSQMQQIADQTGGRMYDPTDIYDLRNVYSEIADDLRIQYTLAYNSTNSKEDGRWREIRVQMRNRHDLAVRTRKGYYAKGPSDRRNP